MKTLVFALALISMGLNGIAQNYPIDPATKKISYSEVLTQTGTADELYRKANVWVMGFYKNASNVVKENTPTKIVADARFKLLNPADKKGVQTMAGIVTYDLVIELKEGRYKYTITNIEWIQTSNFPAERWMDSTSPSYNQNYAHYLKQADDEMKRVLSSLKEAMAKGDVPKPAEW